MTAGFQSSRPRTMQVLQGLVIATAAMLALLPPASVLAQCEGWRVGPFSTGADGTDGTVWAITQWDPDGAGPQGAALVVGGSFTSIEGTNITNLAMRDPASGAWVPVGPNGDAPGVSALTVFEGKLIVGTGGDSDVGTFDETVRAWDGASWESMATTNTGSIYTMHVHDGSLYIGGSFYTTHTIPSTAPANRIARWDPGSQAWDNMNANSNDGQVRALASWNGELIVGGSFSLMGGFPHHGVVRWNGANWLSMGLNPGAGVSTLQPFIGGLYVGGGGLDDGTTNMGGLGRWNGATWSSAGGFFLGTVNEMSVYNGRLIIAGAFGGGSPNITQYDGGSYTGLGSGIGTGLITLFPYGGVLWAGGSFTDAGGSPANRLARWNGSGWSTVGGGSVSGVLAMTSFMGQLVAGGEFSQSTFGTQPAANIVGWNGTSMTPFGAGMNGQINALTSFKYPGALGDFELIAGGYFTQAGGVGANRIARWRVDPINAFPPPAWEPMGAGMDDGAVLAIERFNGVTYAGGTFWSSGGTALASIGRWNETSDVWENIVGANGVVYALRSYGGYLYAGGSFTAIGGINSGGLARYNGSTWSNVGGFFNGSVYELEVYGGLLVIGGAFPGINSSPNLAYYNGSSYGTFGIGGTPGAITALHASGSRLYVGGVFNMIGGVPANRAAYWDGSWHPVSGGTDNIVYALGSLAGEVHAGGIFDVANPGLWSPGWARYTSTGLPWFVQQPFNQNVVSGSNVTFTERPASGYDIQSLQWYRKGAPAVDGPTPAGSTISGSNEETLILENVSTFDAGLYRLQVTNVCGAVWSTEVTLTVDGVTATLPATAITADAIESLGPNPTLGQARLTFALARDARVNMRVHDVTGRLIRRIDAGPLSAGRHQLIWDGRNEAGQPARTGLYFVGLEAGGQALGSRRLVIQQ